eukprot:m.97944 g.97944  ORF g.97944 m.97944 type:complete len:128 (-) comp51377_c0_seq4:70-453(-)
MDPHELPASDELVWNQVVTEHPGFAQVHPTDAAQLEVLEAGQQHPLAGVAGLRGGVLGKEQSARERGRAVVAVAPVSSAVELQQQLPDPAPPEGASQTLRQTRGPQQAHPSLKIRSPTLRNKPVTQR